MVVKVGGELTAGCKDKNSPPKNSEKACASFKHERYVEL
jgi:hypothetical protein